MAAQSGVILECTIALASDSLQLVYIVRNGANREIGLFNRVPEAGPGAPPTFAPDNLYTDLEQNVLHLRKMVLPMPEGLQMSGRPVPGIILLAAGAVFEEELTVVIPAVVNHPFRQALLVAKSQGGQVVTDQLRAANVVKFSVGLFLSDPAFRFEPVSSDHPDVFSVFPPGPAVDRQMILSESMNLPTTIPVLDYRVIPWDEAHKH